jgi:hypothetical protein
VKGEQLKAGCIQRFQRDDTVRAAKCMKNGLHFVISSSVCRVLQRGQKGTSRDCAFIIAAILMYCNRSQTVIVLVFL